MTSSLIAAALCPIVTSGNSRVGLGNENGQGRTRLA